MRLLALGPHHKCYVVKDGTSPMIARCLALTLLFRGAVLGAEPTLSARPPLPVGQIIEDTLATNETPSYSLPLEAGTFLRVNAPFRDGEVHLRLIGPDQKPLREGNQELWFWVAETGGDYRIEVIGPPNRRAPLRYAVLLQELRPAEPTDQKRLTAQRLHEQGSKKAWGQQDSKREAIQILERARALWREVGEKALEASTLLHIKELEWALGEVERGRAHCDEARSIAQQAGARSVEAAAVGDKARLLSRLGHTQEAIDGKKEALELFRAIGDRWGEYVQLANLAADYIQLGDFERALELHESALRYLREIGQVQGEASVLIYLSQEFERLGRWPQALKSAQSAVELSRRERLSTPEASALLRLGTLQSRLGRMDQAVETYQEALALTQKLGDRRKEGIARMWLASAYVASGRATEGRELLDQALLELRATGDRGGELKALYELAKAERALGNWADGLKHVDAVLEIQEATRGELIRPDWRSSFLATKRQSYELAVDLRMAMHRKDDGHGLDAQALSVSERARVRSLIDVLARAGVDPEKGADVSLVKKRREVEAALKAQAENQLRLSMGEHSRTQVAAGEAEAERLTQELREVQGRILATAQNPTGSLPQTLEGSEIGPRLLDADTTLLEYWFGSEHSYVWLVTSSSLEAHELPPQGEVEKMARRAYAQLKSRREGAEAVRALGRTLLGPVAGHLKGSRLLIVADGALQYIPFGALSLPDGAPVISRFVVANLPSASALAVVRREREAHPHPMKLAAVLADPVYSRTDPRVSGIRTASRPSGELLRSVKESGLMELNRLPATQGEAAILRKLISGEGLLEAVGFEANRDTVFSRGLQDYRILHFATHGLVNSLHPELSGLVLSLVDFEGKPRDGFLQAHEIYQLKLGADLAVLSACQTALGKEIRGEGLVGLTRAFMAAGVPRVVASLWSVPDTATAELMKRFYRAVLEDGLAPAAALRRAQNSLRKEKRWSAPYFWAGFTLQGDWN